jgi:hypothetical protein
MRARYLMAPGDVQGDAPGAAHRLVVASKETN